MYIPTSYVLLWDFIAENFILQKDDFVTGISRLVYRHSLEHHSIRMVWDALFSWGYIDGLVQDCTNSSALAMELLQSCTQPSISSVLIEFL